MANQPSIIPSAWAANNSTIENIPATTTETGKASWDQGFPVETSLPLSQGGVPPKYGDFNGILNILSQFALYAQSGGQYAWSNQIDYSVGCVVLGTDGALYRAMQVSGPSTTAVNPVGDTSGKWKVVIDASSLSSVLAEYQKINTQEWSNTVDYAIGALVKGNDGNVYEALQASGPSSTVINPVGDTTITWAKADFYNLQNWVNFGTYTLTPVQDATYTLTTAQGMCYDTTRSHFVVALYSPGETNQELHALDPSNMSIVTAAAHTDLGHANSMTYYPDTDEIVCSTGISDTVDGSSKKRLVVIDAATLTTKRFIYTTNTERHIAYDPVKSVFVMALQSSSATPPWQFERFWKYEPVVTSGSLTGLTLIGSYFDVPLPKTGMHNNGLGCYNGIAFVGGAYWSIIDYEHKRLIYTAPSSQASAEFEDFVYVDGSWYCNTNVIYTIFKFDPSLKSQTSMDRYKLFLDSVLEGNLKITSGNVVHTGTGNTGALRFYASRNGLSDGGQVFICGNGFGGATDRGGVRLMASSPDGTNNCGVQLRVIESGTPTTYVKTFKPWVTETVSLGNASAKWTEVFAAQGAINTSDERLKDNIASIPDAILDAWGEVGWYQFQMKDAMEKKGENARLHSGVIAQRIASVFQSHGLDASRYGLFCHDEWNAEYNEQDDGTSVLALPAGDAYAIRYTEALAMEAAYQRRRADRAETRITALERRLDEMEAVLASLISPVGDETYAKPEQEQDAGQESEE